MDAAEQANPGTREPLLRVRGLRVAFTDAEGARTEVVRGIDLDIARGERVALVGESGCGKSMTSLSLCGLPPTDRASVTGEILFRGQPLRGAGRGVSYVFQDPMASLNPVMRIGAQLMEALPPDARALPRREREERLAGLLAQVDLPSPRALLRSFPCELSGGMCQRVMIAMALAAEPELLVADEPTTALDVTTQADVMDLVGRIVEARGMALLLSTHNLGLVAGRCDAVNVLYAGQVVEAGPARDVLMHPRHPYTQGLLRAVPRLEDGRGNTLRDIPGTVPSPAEIALLGDGCAFRPRCPRATPACLGPVAMRDGVRCALPMAYGP